MQRKKAIFVKRTVAKVFIYVFGRALTLLFVKTAFLQESVLIKYRVSDALSAYISCNNV